MSTDAFLVRPAEETDFAYIYQTWLADLRDSDPSFLPNDLWFPAHREVLRRTFERCQTFILADKEAPDVIVGYLTRDKDYLHWLHIRRSLRNKGLAKYLLLRTGSQFLPLVWRTKLSPKLTNPLRSRQARHAWWSMDAPPSPSTLLSLAKSP